MPFAGKQRQPRDIAALSHDAFANKNLDVLAVQLIESVAICLAESLGWTGAWHDNIDEAGKVTSRDVGLWQINIPASAIGTQTETDLYDETNNAVAMVEKFVARQWQPWASYDSTIYLFDQFIGRAARGVGNYLAGVLLERPAHHLDGTPYVHAWGEPVLDYEFRVQEGAEAITAAERALGWTAKSASQVVAIRHGLAESLTAMKAGSPPVAP